MWGRGGRGAVGETALLQVVRPPPRTPLPIGAQRRRRPSPSRPFRTPPNRHLLPSNPLRTPLGQVLPLRNQTLVNRTGQQGDAVPAHLVAEVLTGDTDA
jgi:hypothetical protein